MREEYSNFPWWRLGDRISLVGSGFAYTGAFILNLPYFLSGMVYVLYMIVIGLALLFLSLYITSKSYPDVYYYKDTETPKTIFIKDKEYQCFIIMVFGGSNNMSIITTDMETLTFNHQKYKFPSKKFRPELLI